MKHKTNKSAPIRTRNRRWIPALVLSALLALGSSGFSQENAETEFKKLSESRKERKALIDYLVKRRDVQEKPNGTLSSNGKLDADAKRAVAAENKTRNRMFELIGKSEKKSPDQVGREFHAKIVGMVGKNQQKLVYDPVLRIDGSHTMGTTLTPKLAEAFLKKQGYKKIETKEQSRTITISGQHPKAGANRFESIVINAQSSARAFSCTEGKAGLLHQKCDIGISARPANKDEADRIASAGQGNMRDKNREIAIATDALTLIVHPRNQTKELTLRNATRVLNGFYRNWASINNGNCSVGEIELVIRHDDSGTFANTKHQLLDRRRTHLWDGVTHRYNEASSVIGRTSETIEALGVVSYSQLNLDVRPLRIATSSSRKAVMPSPESIATKSYPLTHTVYAYLPENAKPMALDFMAFTLSPAGQKIVADAKLIPVKNPMKHIKPVVSAPLRPKLIARPIDFAKFAPEKTAKKAKEKVVEIAKVTLPKPVPTPTPETKPATESISSPMEYEELIKDSNRDLTSENIRFGTRKTYLKPTEESELLIHKIVETFTLPEHQDSEVILIGFADSRGKESANLKDSIARAESIAERLREQGVKKIVTAGFGEAMPVAENVLEEGRTLNRRVEIWIRKPVSVTAN